MSEAACGGAAGVEDIRTAHTTERELWVGMSYAGKLRRGYSNFEFFMSCEVARRYRGSSAVARRREGGEEGFFRQHIPSFSGAAKATSLQRW